MRPGKSKRASTYAGVNPIAIVSTVDATACQAVNHSTSHVDAASERVADRRGVHRLDDERDERPHVEHQEPDGRPDRQCDQQPPREAVHPSTSSVHSSIHVERSASITAGSSERETSGTTAKSTNSGGSSTDWLDGYTNRLSASSLWNSLRDEEVDQPAGLVGRVGAAQDAGELDLTEARVARSRRSARRSGGSAKITSAGGLDP